MATTKKDVVGESRRNAAEAAKQAAELAAVNIQRYLDAHVQGRSQGNNMLMHEEQFKRVVNASIEFAQESFKRFSKGTDVK